MMKMTRKARKAHQKAKCWDKPVPKWWGRSMVRICPHGQPYYASYDMFSYDRKSIWMTIDPFFIEQGCYDA